MQHSKAHPILIHAAAALACLALFTAFIVIGTLTAHAQPTGPGSGTVTSPATSPTGPGAGTVTNPSGSGGCSGQTICNPLQYNSLNDLLGAVLKAAIQLGSIILTIALVWVGFKFVAARGNEEKIRSARTALMWTIIGGLILLGATAIQSVITTTVGNITT